MALVRDLIPVINVKTRKKFEERFRYLLDFEGIFQIDVADGKFTAWKSWNAPADLKEIKGLRHNFEVHLMVAHPEIEVPYWLEAQPQRIIVHEETIKNFPFLLKQCEERKVELALALKPETPLEVLKAYLKEVNYLVLLCVDPGPSGQKFQWYVLDKIKALRQKYPLLNIEADGGINQNNLEEVLKAGANYLALGSALFEANNPKQQIAELRQIIKKYETKEK